MDRRGVRRCRGGREVRRRENRRMGAGSAILFSLGAWA